MINQQTFDILLHILLKKMIPHSRTSTLRTKSQRSNYRIANGFSPSFVPLPIEPPLKKQSRVKTKKQYQQNVPLLDTSAFPIFQKRVHITELTPSNSSQLNISSQWSKKQTITRQKENELLQIKLNYQQKEMQSLKTQLKQLKSSLRQNSERHLREADQLKISNQGLQQKILTQVEQLDRLKKQIESFKLSYSFRSNQGRVQGGGKFEDKNQISRRVEYLQHYEEVAGQLQQTLGGCVKCEQKQRQIEQMRLKYSNQLRSLEQHVFLLKEKELMSQVLQEQVKNKNECIDYLRSQLEIVQSNSAHLQTMVRSLQQAVDGRTGKKGSNWNSTNDSFHSFGGYRY